MLKSGEIPSIANIFGWLTGAWHAARRVRLGHRPFDKTVRQSVSAGGILVGSCKCFCQFKKCRVVDKVVESKNCNLGTKEYFHVK